MSMTLIDYTRQTIASLTATIAANPDRSYNARKQLENDKLALAALTKEQPKRVPELVAPDHIRQPVDAIDYPRLHDQHGYAETSSILQRIVTELVGVHDRIDVLRRQQSEMVGDFAIIDPLALLDGGTVGSPMSAEIAQLQAKAIILQKIVDQYRIRLSYVEAELSNAAVRHVSKEHKKRVAKVAAALEVLREANRQERALVYGLEQLGYTTGLMPFGSYYPNDIDYFDTNGSKGYYFVESIKDYIAK